MLQENWEALKEFWAFIKTWSKTAWFLIITSVLYVVLWIYLEFYVGYKDAREVSQIFYVFVLTIGLVIVYTFKKGRK